MTAVCCNNQMQHMNTPCGQTATTGGTYNYHCALNG